MESIRLTSIYFSQNFAADNIFEISLEFYN
jgi:hypothetical protein